MGNSRKDLLGYILVFFQVIYGLFCILVILFLLVGIAIPFSDEVKDDLGRSAFELSLGEQQRLCLARVLAVYPEVILMDEPCSALDPIATLKIEELMRDLKKEYTIVIVTHNMQQAARVSDWTGLFWLGELVEFGDTDQIFTRPRQQRTEDYITGRLG